MTNTLQRNLIFALLIVIGSFIWALVIPGIVAHYDKVFYQSEIKNKLPGDAKAKLAAFDAEQASRKVLLHKIDSELLAMPTSPETIQALLHLRANVLAQINSASSPISVIPFHLNPQLLLWPAIYISLGWLLLLFRHGESIQLQKRFRLRHIVVVALLVYVIYEWPLWARNFVLSNDGRTVFAYPNVDIDVGSFLIQEAVILGFCFLLALLWLDCIDRYVTLRGERPKEDDPVRSVLTGDVSQKLSSSLHKLQFGSVVLAMGFLFFTHFFWRLVASYGDQRYLLSAVVAHTLWAISWIAISLPTFERWHAWHAIERQALAQVIGDSTPMDNKRFMVDMLGALRPLSRTWLSVSGVTAVTSFLLPIMQLFIK